MKFLEEFMNSINSNNSTNFKIKKLEELFLELSQNDNLKDSMILIELIYNKNVNFYVTKEYLLENSNNSGNKRLSIKELLKFLFDLSERKYIKELLLSIYNDYDNESKNIILRCLDRNLFDGVSNKILEKAYFNVFNSYLYPSFPYMRCSLQDKLKHIKYPAISQLKSDGMFCNLIFSNGKIELYSRQGKIFDIDKDSVLITKLEKDLEFLDTNEKFVILGELVLKENNKILDRKTGNGLLTSLSKMRSTITTLNNNNSKSSKNKLNSRLNEWDEIMEKTHFIVWDILSYDKWIGESKEILDYIERFSHLSDIIKNNNCQYISVTESKIVHSIEEAFSHFQELYDKGEEGTILKNFDMKFKNGTSNDQIKFKAIKQCELKIVGFEYGSGQFSEGIGSFICESSCGLLKSNISGMDRNMRGLELVDKNDVSKGLKRIENFNFDKYIGNIITVEFNEVIKSKNKTDEYSLFLPRILEIREDKDIADSLEYILKL